MSVNTQLVTITVDPDGVNQDFKCLLTLGDYSQERAKTEYACMSSDDSTVGLGSITRTPLEFTGLYNEDDLDGQETLKEAFESNSETKVQIEFDNAEPIGSNGTQLVGNFGISKYIMSFPKDGKIGVAFTLEFVDTPVLNPAGSVGSVATGSWDGTGSVAIGDGVASLTIGVAVASTPTLNVGDDASAIALLLTEAINAEGSYDARYEAGFITISSLTSDELENGTVVTDTSTDTGMTVSVVDLSGAVDPV